MHKKLIVFLFLVHIAFFLYAQSSAQQKVNPYTAQPSNSDFSELSNEELLQILRQTPPSAQGHAAPQGSGATSPGAASGASSGGNADISAGLRTPEPAKPQSSFLGNIWKQEGKASNLNAAATSASEAQQAAAPEPPISAPQAPKNTPEPQNPAPESIKTASESASAVSAAGTPAAPAEKKAPPAQTPAAAPQKQPDPYAHLWRLTKTKHFYIYRDKNAKVTDSTTGIDIILEQIYRNFELNIPWVSAFRSKVYVYKDKDSFVKGQFKPMEWMRAAFLPQEETIVFYDSPKDRVEVKKYFAHELTHMMNKKYYNQKKGDISDFPLWIDEGMAVYMEDITENAAGGGWAAALHLLNIRPQKEKEKKKQPALGIRITDLNKEEEIFYFQDFKTFMEEESLSKAEDISLWYTQAYAMIRFLWKPVIGGREKQMKFEQFTAEISGIDRARKTATKPKSTPEAALKKVYGYKNIEEFEKDFWAWMAQNKAAAARQTDQSRTQNSFSYK